MSEDYSADVGRHRSPEFSARPETRFTSVGPFVAPFFQVRFVLGLGLGFIGFRVHQFLRTGSERDRPALPDS